MSLIYEALQRAEAERAGQSTAASATELLKRAEQQARRQRQAESIDGGPQPAITPHEPVTTGSHGLIADTEQIHRLGLITDTPADSPLNSFQTLHLSLPISSRLVALADKESPAAEAFRLLGVRLRHLRRERTIKRLLVCSTVTQEGKSLISANLSCTIANKSSQNVLLIDGDIRRSTLSEIFGVESRPGLCEYLAGERQLQDSLYRMEEAHLWLMPAGRNRDNLTELVNSDPLHDMLETLGEIFQWVIIDSPPILPLADTSVWGRLSDSILLVTRNGITQRAKLKRGLEAIDNDKLVGAVINSAKTSSEHDYYYYRSNDETRTTEQRDNVTL